MRGTFSFICLDIFPVFGRILLLYSRAVTVIKSNYYCVNNAHTIQCYVLLH